jgi:hypothetical protein
MILFEQEYSLLSKEHFDYTTTNKSFLRTYSVLKQMGIKNNKFFLVLLDTDIRDYDPYDLKDDSLELKLRIVRECKLNPWYFFRTMLRVPAAGTSGIPFYLNRANLAMIWLYFNHIDNMLIMPRQLGKTIGSISITASIIYLLGENITFAMLTKDASLRKENVERLKDIRDALPEWFIHKQRTDTNNTEGVSYDVLNNKYVTFVAQNSIQGAERLGRGMTVPSQHWDETAFFANISTTYPIAISTTNAAIESAKANHQPYGNILTTTAGMLNTDEGKFTHNLICNSMTFTEHLYDLKDNVSLTKVVKMNSPQGMVYSEFSYKQLGKTDEWFHEKAARTAGEEDIIARDYLNKWTFGTSKSPIEKKFLDKLYAGKKEPAYVQYIDEFMIKWYVPEEVVKNKALFCKIPIVIGMDASENVGRDFTSFVFIDARDMSVVATCSCNTSNIIKVAMLVCKWLINSNVVFIPERNSVGVAIVDYCLLHLEQLGINPFTRIYNDVIQDFDSNNISKAELNRPGFYNDHRKSFGFRTSGTSRPFLYKTVFNRVMETSCHNVKDISLINQIAGLTIKNGRIDHGSSGNDDSVIAYILTGYLLFFGNNLDMYDFAKGIIDELLVNLIEDDVDSKQNNIDHVKLEEMKQEITKLEKNARHLNNDTLKIEMMQTAQQMRRNLPKEKEDFLLNINSLTQLKPKKPILIGNNDMDKSSHLLKYLGHL